MSYTPKLRARKFEDGTCDFADYETGELVAFSLQDLRLFLSNNNFSAFVLSYDDQVYAFGFDYLSFRRLREILDV